MSEHTKTPWRVESTWHTNYIESDDNDYIAELPTMIDGELEKHDQDHELIAECEANARLIVKAVNNHDRLVEALTSCLERMEDDWYEIDAYSGPEESGIEGDIEGGLCEAYRNARALLAELESQQ